MMNRTDTAAGMRPGRWRLVPCQGAPLRGGATSAIEPANVANPRLVSVIVPCHNGARFLAEAIESALAQTHPAIETIVVDDDRLDRRVRLRKRALDRLGEEPRSVVTRDDDADEPRVRHVRWLDSGGRATPQRRALTGYEAPSTGAHARSRVGPVH